MNLSTIRDPQLLRTLQEITDRLTKLEVKDLDMKGRKVVEAGRSNDQEDYTTKAELLEVKNKILELESAIKSLEPRMRRVEIEVF